MQTKTGRFSRRKVGKRTKIEVRRHTAGWIVIPATDSTANKPENTARILEKAGAEPEKAENPSEPEKELLAPQAEDIVTVKETEPKNSKVIEVSVLPPGEIPDIGELSKSYENGTTHVYVAKNRKSRK